MIIIKDIAILLVSIIVIGKGAVWLVDAAARVAKHFGISELVIGLTVVAFGTSAPEFGVTILAAIRGMGDISVGNIVGSNIFNYKLDQRYIKPFSWGADKKVSFDKFIG